jgi:hypothetical protein
LKKAVIDLRLSDELKEEGKIDKTLLEYSKSEFYPEKVRQQIKHIKTYYMRKIAFFDRFSKLKCKILSSDDFYDEAFTSCDKNKIYLLDTHMKFLAKDPQIVNQMHGYFFDLIEDQKLNKDSFY